VGTDLTIKGSGFTSATDVSFNGTSATFTVVSDTTIRTSVPAGATSCPISVTTLGGVATSTASFTVIPADTQPPTVPTNLAATAVSTSQITLAWTASTDNVGVAGYNVFRDGGTTPIATVIGTFFADTGLAPTTTHTYTVVAFDAAGNQSPPSNAASATTQPPPAPVAQLNPRVLNFGPVKLRANSAPRRVTLTNTGTAILTIASMAIGGADPGDFAIAARTCGASLATAASCTVDVTFRPTVRATRSGTLAVTDNAAGSPHVVALTGTGR
jgi:hypothetical protein